MEKEKFAPKLIRRESVKFTGDYDVMPTMEKRRLIEVDALRRSGDLKLASEILDMPIENVKSAFSRVGSKHHAKVVDTLEMIIENRRKILNND